MRRSMKITTTAAALVAGGALMASPAMAAGFGPGSGTCTGTQVSAPSTASQGFGRMGRGMMANGAGQRGGMQSGSLYSVPSGTLTETQKSSLAYMAEEEKLAHDVYTRLAERYPTATVFTRIAASEQQHLDAVRTLLSRYGIADPTAGKAIGQFASADIASLYGDLLDSATTLTAAYDAGVAIEQDDIAELDKAGVGVTAPDVLRVYSNLRTASERHLAAFENHR